jgi:hypothetical protein
MRKLAAPVLVLGLGPLALLADSSPQQRPVFRAGVELVTVDVVVTDSDDRPITDLSADDFEILDDKGRRQTIAEFAPFGGCDSTSDDRTTTSGRVYHPSSSSATTSGRAPELV